MDYIKCSGGSILRNVQLRGGSCLSWKLIYFHFYLVSFIKLKTDNVEGINFTLLKV